MQEMVRMMKSNLWFGTSGVNRSIIHENGDVMLGDTSNTTGTGWGPALWFGMNPGGGGRIQMRSISSGKMPAQIAATFAWSWVTMESMMIIL